MRCSGVIIGERGICTGREVAKEWKSGQSLGHDSPTRANKEPAAVVNLLSELDQEVGSRPATPFGAPGWRVGRKRPYRRSSRKPLARVLAFSRTGGLARSSLVVLNSRKLVEYEGMWPSIGLPQSSPLTLKEVLFMRRSLSGLTLLLVGFVLAGWGMPRRWPRQPRRPSEPARCRRRPPRPSRSLSRICSRR